jgi:histidinol-phosphate aminotransferase
MAPIRPDLDSLPAYVPGRVVPGAIKLASNEVAAPPPPRVLAAIAEAAAAVNRYPDLSVTGLTVRLADEFGLDPARIAVGCGSVSLCQQLVSITCREPGDEVVYAWRSFEAYPIVVQISGARSVAVPLTADEHHDLDAMADAITDRTRLVLVCSPNNPTGTSVRRDRLERFLDRVPADVLVVIDEAYREFVRDPEVPDAIDVYRDRPNVAVLRTFSKAYGLAGLRVGFAVAHEPVAEALRKSAVPFGVSGLAQVAAVASLGAEQELLERVDTLVAERARVQRALREQGWTGVPESQANFVWLRLGERTEEFAAACEEAGVVVRPFAGEGARVTIGEPEANDLFLRVAKGFVV